MSLLLATSRILDFVSAFAVAAATAAVLRWLNRLAVEHLTRFTQLTALKPQKLCRIKHFKAQTSNARTTPQPHPTLFTRPQLHGLLAISNVVTQAPEMLQKWGK